MSVPRATASTLKACGMDRLGAIRHLVHKETMLALESPRWAHLKTAGGGADGRTCASLIGQVRAGSRDAMQELFEQCCHQFSVGDVAFAVVPHLVDLAAGLAPPDRLDALRIVGAVQAGRSVDRAHAPPVPPDLDQAYFAANARALQLAAHDLLERLTPSHSMELIGVISALRDHADLAMHILLAGGNTDLHCPECGESIKFGDSQG